MSDHARLLYCHCAYAQAVPQAVKQTVLERLTESGVEFECVSDLCEMSARRDPMLNELAHQGPVRIAACYPRAVEGLFTAAGCPLPKTGIEIVNMRTLDGPAAAEAMLKSEPCAGATVENTQ